MLKKCLAKYKKMVTLYLTNGIVQVSLSLLSIVYFQKLIDAIAGKQSIHIATNLLLIYGVLQLLDYIDNYPISILQNGFYYQLKIKAMKKISTIDFLRYKNYGTGEIIQLVENGADAGRKILFKFYLNIFRNLLPSILISMILIGIYDFKVLIAIMISYGFVFLITKILLKKLYLVKNTTLINEEMFTSKIVRAFMEMVVFRLNRRCKSDIKECEKRLSIIVKSRTKILMTHELFFTSFAVIVAIIKIVAIFVGIKQVLAGTSSVGVIVALVALIDRVYTPIAIFNVEYVDYKLNKVALARFEKLINQPDDLMLEKGDVAKISNGNISFDQVSFSYEKVKVLDKLSLRFGSGKTYAIVGPSGVGKTTMLNLLAGLIKAAEGKMVIDTQDLSAMNLNSYYKHIAYLTQYPAVFDGTVRENLVFDTNVSDDKLWSALEKVNLANRIQQMKNGLYEQVGEKGNILSGGEKQRLALARIIVMPPKIIILDEPTNALDNINESIVMKNVFSALSNSTVIAVTHRVHTTHIFDEVIVLNKGKVEAVGKADNLLKTSRLFQKLYQTEKENNLS